MTPTRRHWAVCVTGELRSAACKAKEGPEGSTPALSQRKKVLGLLWGANVTHDTFLVLDGRANSSAQASSLLRHVVGALRPVAVALDKPEDEAEAWSRYQLGPGRVTRAAASYAVCVRHPLFVASAGWQWAAAVGRTCTCDVKAG